MRSDGTLLRRHKSESRAALLEWKVFSRSKRGGRGGTLLLPRAPPTYCVVGARHGEWLLWWPLVVFPANGHIYLKALVDIAEYCCGICTPGAHTCLVEAKQPPLSLCLVRCYLSPLSRVQDIFRRLTNPTLKKLYRFVLKRLVGRFLDDDIALEVGTL